MKIAKKVLAAAMVLAMIAALSVMAFAAGTPTITVGDAKVDGDKLTVNVYINDAVGLQSFGTTIAYDTAVLEFSKCKPGADASTTVATGNAFSSENNDLGGSIEYAGYFKENLYDAATWTEEEEVTVNATHFHAATLTFKIKDADALNTKLTVAIKNSKGLDGVQGAEETIKLKDGADVTPVEPEKPSDDKEEESKPVNPPTGDDKPTGDNMALYAAGAVAVLAGAAFIISKKRK